MSQSRSLGEGRSKLYVVGTGPGNEGQLTPRALEAIRDSDTIIGNKLYLDLIRSELQEKSIINSSMVKFLQVNITCCSHHLTWFPFTNFHSTPIPCSCILSMLPFSYHWAACSSTSSGWEHTWG